MFDMNDTVRILSGAREGEVGRVVVRKPITVEICAFRKHDVVFGVVFDFNPRGYPVFYKTNQLERTS